MLTKKLIDQLQPKATRYVEWDRDLAGFGLRVMPTGRKAFILSYRMPGARQAITATIGVYGQITLPQARTQAREMLSKARLNSDPQAARKARAAAEATQAKLLTVTALVQQYTEALQSGTAQTGRSRGQPVEAYVADTLVHLGRFAARYGKQPAAAITRGEVVTLLNDYVKQPAVHRRMHGAISRMYSWARRQDLVANKPTDDIVTNRPSARERVLSLQELATIWRAADQLEPLYRDLVHLLMLTGQRRNEVAGMVWGELNLTTALWTLPGGRTKARRQHVIPLPATAVAILQARQRGNGEDLVLPTLGRDGKTIAPVSGWNWLKRELDSRLAIPPWRMHDFRRSLVTILAEHGADVAVLDSLLNHAASATRSGVIGVYQRATLTGPMRVLMQQWDALLSDAVHAT